MDITHTNYQATHGNQRHIPDMNRESLRTLQAKNRIGTPGSQPAWGQWANESMLPGAREFRHSSSEDVWELRVWFPRTLVSDLEDFNSGADAENILNKGSR